MFEAANEAPMVSPQPNALLTEAQVSELLGVTPHTLAVWRCTARVRLPYIKLGRCVRYRREDIEAYVAASVHHGTREVG